MYCGPRLLRPIQWMDHDSKSLNSVLNISPYVHACAYTAHLPAPVRRRFWSANCYRTSWGCSGFAYVLAGRTECRRVVAAADEKRSRWRPDCPRSRRRNHRRRSIKSRQLMLRWRHVQSCPVAHWSSFLRLEHHQRRSAVASQSSCAAAAIRPIFSPSVISLRSLGRFRSYFAKKIINGTSHCSSSNISSREHGTEAENQDVHSRLTEPSVWHHSHNVTAHYGRHRCR